MVIINKQSINMKTVFTTCKGTNDIEIKVDEKGVVIKDHNGKN